MTDLVSPSPQDDGAEATVDTTVISERPSGSERANAPVSEVAERFLKVIVETVPLARMTEVHLFSPLRQGLVETGIAVVAADLPGSTRHTVYTARYRLVIKGPERGKWEADVVAEADAPLVTVETVVRGVQRRAGEESEIICYAAEQVAKAVRAPWPPVVEAEAVVESPAVTTESSDAAEPDSAA